MPGLQVSWRVPLGDDRFGDVVPFEEVCLGAEQHDVGHTAWEQAPTLNQEKGLPYSFLEMPRQLHVRLWSQAAQCVLRHGRYAALLVWAPWHSTLPALRCGQRSPEKTPRPSSTRLSQERAFQEELRTHLRTDPHYGPYATEEVVERNRRLVGVWDALSLAICFGHHHPQSWQQVPTATSTTTLTLTARDDDPTQLMITPWPFRRQRVTLVYEGRYLTETYSNEAEMREALKQAPWVTLQTVLVPGEIEWDLRKGEEHTQTLSKKPD